MMNSRKLSHTLALSLVTLLIVGCGDRKQDTPFRPSEGTTANASGSCRLVLDVAGVPDAHERLASLAGGESYLVCPFAKGDAVAMVTFMPDIAGRCGQREVVGLAVKRVDRREPEKLRNAGKCSAVFSPDTARARVDHYTTYVWELKKTLLPFDVRKVRVKIDQPVMSLMLQSGLPFVRFGSAQNVFCFEVAGPESRGPAELLKELGFSPSLKYREIKVGEERCEAAVQRLFNVSLPIISSP